MVYGRKGYLKPEKEAFKARIKAREENQTKQLNQISFQSAIIFESVILRRVRLGAALGLSGRKF